MTLLDNLILLAAAALVTGLLVPFVSARMNERRAIQQRQAAEDLARDSKFIEAQAAFLDGLSADLWRFAGKILAVSYYATASPQQFPEAWRVYDESSFDELFALRAHVSRAQRLVSAEAKRQLAELHIWLFGTVDPRLTTAARASLADARGAGDELGVAPPGHAIGDSDWSGWHQVTMTELFTRVDATLATIAREVGVTERQRRQEPDRALARNRGEVA
jgi:hypothetical protein